MSDVKHMDVREFRELGLLQELNRQFLHPLGLALEVVQEEDGTERLGGIWDYRDDPVGIEFAPDCLSGEDAREKAARVAALRASKTPHRIARLGAVIQPIDTEAA